MNTHEKIQGYYAKLHELQKIEESRQEWNDRVISRQLAGQNKWPEEAIIERLKKEAQKWKSSH